MPDTKDDDGGVGTNSRLKWTAEESGTHYVAVRAYGPDKTGTYTLSVAERPPGMRVADAEGREGDDAVVRFEVTLDWAVSGPVTVAYETRDGTAVAGEDYEAASGTLTFAAGETKKSVEVAIIDDTVEDSGETFTLRLSGANGAVLDDAEATGTIFNTEDTDWPADTSTAGRVSVGGSTTARNNHNGDHDWIAVDLVAGQSYWIDLVANGRTTGGTTGGQAGSGHASGGDLRRARRACAGHHRRRQQRVLAKHGATPGCISRRPGAEPTTSQRQTGIAASTGPYTVSVTEANGGRTWGRPPAPRRPGSAVGDAGPGGHRLGRATRDWYAVQLQAGVEYVIDLKGLASGSEGGPLKGAHLFGGLRLRRHHHPGYRRRRRRPAGRCAHHVHPRQHGNVLHLGGFLGPERMEKATWPGT